MQRLILCALAAMPLAAHAGSFTTTNTTAVTAWSGNSPAAYFSGDNPYVAQAPVGTDFETSALTVQTQDQAGLVLVDFSYTTRFSGTDLLADVPVAYADIFLAAGTGGGTQGFTYAISLGQQAANGGVAAGFYSVGEAATSQSIWSSRPGFIFGGAFGSSAAYLPGQPGYAAMAAPTVLTAGQRLSGVTVTQTALDGGWYDLDAQIALTPAQAAVFAGGMDVFWGTGDCANGSFLAEIPDLAVPEPCSAVLLISAIGFGMVRRGRHRRKMPGAVPAPPNQPSSSGRGRVAAFMGKSAGAAYQTGSVSSA